MWAMYADNKKNLVGNANVGLPIPPEVLQTMPNILQVEVLTEADALEYYDGTRFYTAEEWAALSQAVPPIYTVTESTPLPTPPESQNAVIIVQNYAVLNQTAQTPEALAAQLKTIRTLYFSGAMMEATLDEAVLLGVVTQEQADQMRLDKQNGNYSPQEGVAP